MSIDEVKRTIRRGNEAAQEGRQTVEQALVEAAEAGGLARAAMHDSDDERVEQTKAKLASLDREVKLAVRRFEAAVKSANAYLAKL